MKLKTLAVVYDLEVGPVSFDFVTFLIKAEAFRVASGMPSMHVIIVPFAAGIGGMFRDKTQFYDEHEARWRLWNICIPACALVNASVTLATGWDQATMLAQDCQMQWPQDWDHQTLRHRHHLVGDLLSSKKSIPMLRASPHALRVVDKRLAGRPFVTMTHRNTYLRGRNVDFDEWLKAKRHIVQKGYQVENIYDVSTALSSGIGFSEFSLDLRMAMYQQAAFNIQANNGTASLCWFSEKPYAMFDAGVGDSRDEWKGLFEDQGLKWGANWPWAKPHQTIVYERSTADVIIREFEKWASAMS